MQELTIAIGGMSCGHCVQQVEQGLRRLEGVEVRSVEVGEARVAYDPEAMSATEIEEAVRRLGYQAQAPGRTA